MLTARAIDCIRGSVDADLGLRSTNIAAAVNACDSEFARHGAFNSSMRIRKRGVVACQELTVRAEIIWGIIQQCRRLFGAPDEVLIADLRQQVSDHITGQVPVILQLAGRVTDARQANSIEQSLIECRDRLIGKFSNQVLLFVEELKQEPRAEVAQPPASSRETTPVASILNISSYAQSQGITAHTVNIVGGASEPARPARKPRWWQSWWASVSGIAVILAGVIPTLDYFHVEWSRHHEPTVAGQARHGNATASPVPISGATVSRPLTPAMYSSSAPPSLRRSIVKPAAGLRHKRVDERNSATRGATSVVNSVGTVYNNSGIIAPGATGTITQQVQGYIPPPPRVMKSEQMDAAVARLQMAPLGSIARLNYAASDNNKEVRAFFTQVETVFRRADHWKVSTQEIGKSMGTVDGGTLTGEGIGCTVAGIHGSVAIDAMAAAGFPCTRKAADWDAVNPPPSDVVISIGSRIVPIE